ncbi:hypothetical protein [Massilia sp. CF038]|uniref:hypothetical protein n=1 Tax=Massilia sp. CF038 TaxID=1881045 RepID=UPI00091F6887|nr:hypothetical protein [Massilia sp. CF038]SHH55312.1 hypothetical protein SAMN05428948_4427 [Massilia sp. CF038]
MKHFFSRTGVALACALGLASCGGGDNGQLQISVTLVNVTKPGLKLQNNGGNFYDVPPGAVYSFPDLIPIDGSFDIVAQGQPPNTTKCEVVNGKKKATNISLQTIRVECTLITYHLGGTISGLTGDGLVLVNGTDKKTIPAGTTSFNLTVDPGNGGAVTGKVPEDAPYGVLIFNQPAGQTCTVANGTGKMPAADNATINITCV